MNRRVIAAGVLLVLASGCAEGRIDSVGSTVSPQVSRPSPMPSATSASGGTGQDQERSAASQVSPRVASMTVDYTSPFLDHNGKALRSHTFHKVVTGPVVAQLVARLNELVPPEPGSGACARDDGERFVLVMDSAGTSLSFSLRACGRVDVIAGGQEQPQLETTGALDARVASDAGATTSG